MEPIKWHETAGMAYANGKLNGIEAVAQAEGSASLSKKEKKIAEETTAVCASCVLSGEYLDEDNGDIVRYAGEGKNRDQTDTRGKHLIFIDGELVLRAACEGFICSITNSIRKSRSTKQYEAQYTCPLDPQSAAKKFCLRWIICCSGM